MKSNCNCLNQNRKFIEEKEVQIEKLEKKNEEKEENVKYNQIDKDIEEKRKDDQEEEAKPDQKKILNAMFNSEGKLLIKSIKHLIITINNLYN